MSQIFMQGNMIKIYCNYVTILYCSGLAGMLLVSRAIPNSINLPHMAWLSFLPSHYIIVTQFEVHFNYFYCTNIYNKLRRHIAMLTYIYMYLGVEECWLTSSIPQQRINSIFLSIMLIMNKMRFLNVMATLALTWSECISFWSYHMVYN